MISVEEAKKKAQEARGSEVNKCQEYPDAFILSNTDDDNYDGGYHQPVVVLKEDGRILNMMRYITSTKCKPDDVIKEFQV